MVVKVNYKLEVDYKSLFKTWYEPLKELFNTDYMYNMMVFLNEGYKIKSFRPAKQDIFRVFNLVNFSDIRVIIIGDEPYHDDTNIGIAYGQKDSLVPNNEIVDIEKCIERTCYDKFNLHMDSTLVHWLEQGVLPLHASLTVQQGIAGSHKFHWREFMRHLIQVVNIQKPGTIFMLWGDDAKYYKQYINPAKHYILEADSVTETVAKGWDWNSDCFAKCNKIITDTNGREFQIEW